MALLTLVEVCVVLFVGTWAGSKFRRAPGLGAFLGMGAAIVALGFGMFWLHDFNAALLG